MPGQEIRGHRGVDHIGAWGWFGTAFEMAKPLQRAPTMQVIAGAVGRKRNDI